MASKRPRQLQELAKRLQDRFWSHFGSHLEPFWSHLGSHSGAIFEQFGRKFGSRCLWLFEPHKNRKTRASISAKRMIHELWGPKGPRARSVTHDCITIQAGILAYNAMQADAENCAFRSHHLIRFNRGFWGGLGSSWSVFGSKRAPRAVQEGPGALQEASKSGPRGSQEVFRRLQRR